MVHRKRAASAQGAMQRMPTRLDCGMTARRTSSRSRSSSVATAAESGSDMRLEGGKLRLKQGVGCAVFSSSTSIHSMRLSRMLPTQRTRGGCVDWRRVEHFEHFRVCQVRRSHICVSSASTRPFSAMSASPAAGAAASVSASGSAWDFHAARLRERLGAPPTPLRAPSLFGAALTVSVPASAAPSPQPALRMTAGTAPAPAVAHAAAVPAVPLAPASQRRALSGPPPGQRVSAALEFSEAAGLARANALQTVRKEASKLSSQLAVETARRRDAEAELQSERAERARDQAEAAGSVQRLNARLQQQEHELRALRAAVAQKVVAEQPTSTVRKAAPSSTQPSSATPLRRGAAPQTLPLPLPAAATRWWEVPVATPSRAASPFGHLLAAASGV